MTLSSIGFAPIDKKQINPFLFNKNGQISKLLDEQSEWPCHLVYCSGSNVLLLAKTALKRLEKSFSQNQRKVIKISFLKLLLLSFHKIKLLTLEADEWRRLDWKCGLMNCLIKWGSIKKMQYLMTSDRIINDWIFM